jgi:hypothetical protein
VSSSTSALETGRWVVAEKMIDRPFSQDRHFRDHTGNITLDGYKRGDNSLGIRMDYRPTNCVLPNETAVKSARILDECMEKSELDFSRSSRQLHIVFVGDSNTEKQWSNDMKSGISDHYIVSMNSGLHDISLLCGAEYFGLHIDFSARGVGRCIDAYRSLLRDFARVAKSFPSAWTIFQTTTASWPRWGAFGNAWLAG